MKSKIVVLLLTVTLVLSTGIGAFAAVQVTDISGHRSEAVIQEAMDLGVIKGYPDGTYRPNGLIKREEFFSIIQNVLTIKPDTSGTKLDFIDVDPIEWYIPVIKTMVEAKITEGIGWGKVGIGLNITRQEAIKILATIIPTMELPKEDVAVLARDEDTIAAWAAPYYQIMFKKGYLNNTEGILGPTVALTREEAAILLLKIKKGEKVIAGNANQLINDQPTSGGCISNEGHTALSGAFTEGEGTKADPYQISSQEQLNHMRQHLDKGEFFVLTNDIHLTKDFETSSVAFTSEETDWSGGNFRPIGSKGTPFIGTFDGNGKTIDGLNILGTVKAEGLEDARVLASHVGLFGYIGQNGLVTNLAIDDSQISGKEYTGGIAGYCEGIIQYCGIGIETIIRGGSYTGGITGYNGQKVEYCYSIGEIAGTTATGNLIGNNQGVLQHAYWLSPSTLDSVGVAGTESSIQDVVSLTRQEFDVQDIEDLIQKSR